MTQKINASAASRLTAKPFLKWVGGKGQLLEQICRFLPNELAQGTIVKYVEPFVGSGAVFFYLAQVYEFKQLYISDINPELILAYKTIQQNVNTLIELLNELQNKYLSFNEFQRKEFYYHIRSQYNLQRKAVNFQNYSETWQERTAQLIFLNRTCFNGLFRVNSKGEFNVPMGKYKKPLICNSENLKAIAKILQQTEIHNSDFTDCEQWVDSQTFVYFDPPYKPISATASFTSYSKHIFDDNEQLRLRDFFQQLDAKEAKLMLSNSDPKNEDPNNHFFETAYSNYTMERVQAKRNINSNAQKRGKINEILVMNY